MTRLSPRRRTARLRAVGPPPWHAAAPLLRRFGDANDRAADSADRSDESLQQYDHILAEEAELCAVPADLLRAICWYASGWRQFEPSGRPLATPDAHGARWGCMQLSDHWHPDAFPAAMSDVRANVRYAGNLLCWLYEQTGSWQRATVAYFGHDAPAEHAARRVRHYRRARPWLARLSPGAVSERASAGLGSGSGPISASVAGPEQLAASTEPPLDDLYAGLAL